MAVQSSTIIIIHLDCTNTGPYSTTYQANVVLHDQYHHWLSIVNSFHAKHKYCCNSWRTREAVSLLLSKSSSSPAFSTLHCTKLPSWERYQLQPCSHRSHLHWNHCPLPKKAHSRRLQASPVAPCVSNKQSFLEKYMTNFQQLVALGNQNFSATKNIPCDSTTFALSADVLKKSIWYTVRKLRSVKKTWQWMTKMGARTS